MQSSQQRSARGAPESEWIKQYRDRKEQTSQKRIQGSEQQEEKVAGEEQEDAP